MAKSTKVKVVYVLSREHYHFPPNDSDIVAATPIEVHEGSDIGYNYLTVKANKLAREQCAKFGGEVKEFTSPSRVEYRTWNDSPSPHADKFVYVVRRVDYVG